MTVPKKSFEGVIPALNFWLAASAATSPLAGCNQKVKWCEYPFKKFTTNKAIIHEQHTSHQGLPSIYIFKEPIVDSQMRQKSSEVSSPLCPALKFLSLAPNRGNALTYHPGIKYEKNQVFWYLVLEKCSPNLWLSRSCKTTTPSSWRVNKTLCQCISKPSCWPDASVDHCVFPTKW